MQRSLAPIIAGCVAALVFAAPKPASAMTAPAVHYGETDAGIVQPVKKGGTIRGTIGAAVISTATIRAAVIITATIGITVWGRPGITLRF